MLRITRSRLLASLAPVLVSSCAAAGSRPIENAATNAATNPVAEAVAKASTNAGTATPPARLSRSVAPTRYALDLTIDPATPTFEGSVTVDLAVRETTTAFWMHAQDLTIDAASLTVDGKTIPTRVEAVGERHLRIVPGAPLPQGTARLALRYRGQLDGTRSRGLYRVQEPDGAWHAYTFFQPVDARRAFPCFDEPGFKVPWQLTLRAPRGQLAAANTRLAERHTDGAHEVFTFEESVPLPSYLVAFVVGPFDAVESGTAGHHGTPLRFVLPAGRASELGYARRVTPTVVGHLEDYFGMPYPFGKLDVAVVPRFWGTMEHPGIVAMGQPLTLIPKDGETLDRKRQYANILAHELGHYWFGDYVTAAGWDEIWLNESFGTWLDAKITNRVDPSWDMLTRSRRLAQQAMKEDELTAAKAIREPIASDDDAEASFDNNITYFKGASVLHMVESWVGEATFQRAVRRYMKDRAFSTATSEDFYRALTAEAGPQATEALRGFVEKRGIPVVDVKLTCAAGRSPEVTLRQERLLRGDTRDAETRWTIPVCLRWEERGSSKRTCLVLTEKEQTAPLGDTRDCPPWVVGNAAADGYYRTRYDATLGRSLPAASARLTPQEAISLAGDLGSLAAKGTVDPTLVVDMTRRLAADRRADVVGAGAWLFTTVTHRHLGEAAVREPLARAVQAMFGPTARRLGWLARRGEPVPDADLRHRVLSLVARVGDDATMQRDARRLVDTWLRTRQGLDADTLGTALGGATYHAGPDLWSALLQAAKTSSDRDVAETLYGSLGTFADPELAVRLIEATAKREIEARDVERAIGYVLQQRETRPRALAAVFESWNDLTATMRDDEVQWLVGAAATSCDAEDRRSVAAFFATPRAHTGSASRELAKALEASDACIAERARLEPVVRAFIGPTR